MKFKVSSSFRSSRILAGVAGAAMAVVPIVGLTGPAAAATVPHPPTGSLAPFFDCPVDAILAPGAPVVACTVSSASTGYFRIGNYVIPFKGPGTVQGGITQDKTTGALGWVGALDGNTFSSPPQLMPGGIGRALGNPSLNQTIPNPQVHAIPLLAGAVGFQSLIPVLLQVPLKFHIVGPLVGPNCYFGSNANPIVLNLTSGTSGNLTGSLGQLSIIDNGNVIHAIGAELVDNIFTIPVASGCGPGGSGSLDSTIDAVQGLPSPSGSNSAVFFGNIYLGSAKAVEKNENNPSK
jgi:hypothetical protein